MPILALVTPLDVCIVSSYLYVFTVGTVFAIGTVFTVGTVFSIGTVLTVDTVFAIGTVLAVDTVFSVGTVFAIDTAFSVSAVLTVDTVFTVDAVFSVGTVFAVSTFFSVGTVLTVDTVISVSPVSTILTVFAVACFAVFLLGSISYFIKKNKIPPFAVTCIFPLDSRAVVPNFGKRRSRCGLCRPAKAHGGRNAQRHQYRAQSKKRTHKHLFVVFHIALSNQKCIVCITAVFTPSPVPSTGGENFIFYMPNTVIKKIDCSVLVY